MTASSIGSVSLPGEGVLLARMERADDRPPVGQRRFGAVAEARAGPEPDDRRQRGVREPAERDVHPSLLQRRQLALQERPARVALLRRGLVARRGAADRGDDVGAVQPQPVVAPRARRLVGQPGPVQRAVEPVARAVAGEHPPGPVGAVGRRGQADQDDPGVRVAEAGHRAAPVLLVAEGRPLLERHLLPPRHEPRAGPAADDLLAQLGQRPRPHVPDPRQGAPAQTVASGSGAGPSHD